MRAVQTVLLLTLTGLMLIVGQSVVPFVVAEQKPDSGASSLKVQPTLAPLSGRVIALDPGHGGIDGGAIGLGGTALEKEIALNIARFLRDYVQEAGAFVVMTRDDDRMLDDGSGEGTRKARDLRARMAIMNDPAVDIALSIHLNAVPSPRWYGAETFYADVRPENACLAEAIQAALKDIVGTPRHAKRSNTLFVLRTMRPVGALVEVGYLSNPDEARRLIDPNYQRKIAFALSVGLMRYFAEDPARCADGDLDG
ncbi:MAG: N-acetylmuramoyl-L-alanine amidase [Hydrogenibacillus sp.]|nr:N-acetylmuramoyl-L-alanine amidase [Hydrogenibacillus sp.]